MSEIAKCPLCGKDVKNTIWRPEYEGCAGSVVVTVKCCGMEALTVELWNRYAAAMELAMEVLRLHKDDSKTAHQWEFFVEEAEKRVLEVFK